MLRRVWRVSFCGSKQRRFAPRRHRVIKKVPAVRAQSAKYLYYRLGALIAAYGCLLLYNFDDFAFVFGFGGVGIGGSGALENL